MEGGLLVARCCQKVWKVVTVGVLCVLWEVVVVAGDDVRWGYALSAPRAGIVVVKC